MIINRSIPAAAALASSLFCGPIPAASMGGGVVYEKVDMFSNSVHFTDSFTVGSQGTYTATLTDFEFPNPFAESGLNVTTATAALGQLLGPGSFTFDAAPGDYYVSMFASVAPVSAEQRTEMVKAEQKAHGDAWWHSLTEEQKQERRDLWKTWTEEEKKANAERSWRRAERRVAQQLAEAADNLGQYGVQIALLDNSVGATGGAAAVVPVPGAVWLFGTGLIGLLGFARRRA
jgi:hypothetical protein